jgi:hypothetical protein
VRRSPQLRVTRSRWRYASPSLPVSGGARAEDGLAVAGAATTSRRSEFSFADEQQSLLGHGLYSTVRDYIRFEQALLRASWNEIGDLDFSASFPSAHPVATCNLNVGPGHKWGFRDFDKALYASR